MLQAGNFDSAADLLNVPLQLRPDERGPDGGPALGPTATNAPTTTAWLTALWPARPAWSTSTFSDVVDTAATWQCHDPGLDQQAQHP